MHSFQHAVLIVNEDDKRFEMEVDNYLAYIEFVINVDNVVFLTHTEVPEELSGRGVGSELVFRALNWIQDKDFTLAPLCPFVISYLKKHSEWTSILAKGFHV